MPNLQPPVTTTATGARPTATGSSPRCPPAPRFEPLMTLYLTDHTDAAEIARAKASGFVHAVKYYPAGATTNSDCRRHGDRARLSGAGGDGDARRRAVAARRSDRSGRRHVRPRARVRRAPSRRASCATSPACAIVLEHITTREAADFVARGADARRRDDHAAAPPLFAQRALRRRPAPAFLLHADPEARRRIAQALVAAATSGSPKFFLGTDSAPHAKHTKESACCGAGCYTAHAALELYAEAFEDAGALDRLEGVREPLRRGLLRAAAQRRTR